MNKLSNQPPKGTSDWLPGEFQIRKYIFDTWRKVCTSFGYEEYLTPQIELADVYRAKSGEDLGGKELWTLTDLKGREFAIRPEMTPSVTRMVTRIYQDTPKPIRLFSIANFMRNEKPQRGRNREFWQLNFDIFGVDSVNADIEVLQVALEIMLGFNPPKGSFVMYINNRRLIDYVLNEVVSVTEEQRTQTVRILDKWEKLNEEEFAKRLKEDAALNDDQIESLKKFMQSQNGEDLVKNLPEIEGSEGLKEINETMEALNEMGYSEWISFNPSVIRGFDYYDGMVFEVFDKNPENSRSMFGGGRYNGLAALFGSQSFPATGCAPGDETTRLFLEGWNLLDQAKENKPKSYYLPLLDESFVDIRDSILNYS
ncbi:MAG: ATP phosphoribosyltransferase regulatory subunit [Candidatus Dojkabacteria bacterium]|nr:ATP phosphoribosyltransferase regulatory subunit [Candidatus Dojkabacteria bacterium]